MQGIHRGTGIKIEMYALTKNNIHLKQQGVVVSI